MVGIETARNVAMNVLQKSDRSAFILSKYIVPRAHDAFLGLRLFNVETARIVDGCQDQQVAKIRLEWWKSAIQKIHSPQTKEEEEPVSILLQHAVRCNVPVPKRFLLTVVQTRESRLRLVPFRTIEDMERLGEGTMSQILYALLEALQTRETSEFLAAHASLDELVSNALAHVGQATGIALSLKQFYWYAQKHNYVNLPVDSLASQNLSQQAILDSIEAKEHPPNLDEVVFEVATRANDHCLAASSLLEQIRNVTGSAPSSLLLTLMSIIPVQLYLEGLEKANFDLRRISPTDYKLPWRSWRAYRTKRI